MQTHPLSSVERDLFVLQCEKEHRDDLKETRVSSALRELTEDENTNVVIALEVLQ